MAPPRDVEAKLARVERALRERHAGVLPDAGFAARVAAALPAAPPDALGWAASRLLPVGVALALVLAGLALQAARAEARADEPARAAGWAVSTALEEAR